MYPEIHYLPSPRPADPSREQVATREQGRASLGETDDALRDRRVPDVGVRGLCVPVLVVIGTDLGLESEVLGVRRVPPGP